MRNQKDLSMTIGRLGASLAAALALASPAALALPLSSCSSAPKRPPEVFTNRNAAIGQIDLANKAVAKGDYATADLFLDEAWRLAVSADDPDTRTRVHLARGNARYNEGKAAEAETLWQTALSEAETAKVPMLVSTARIYLARASLAEGRKDADFTPEERQERARKARDVAQAEMKGVKDNILFTAFAWKVIGFAEKELGNAGAAEKAILEAAELHDKNQYLEDAAYDWYLIASVRSRAGNLPGAREALDTALAFDRRAENSNGLGMDWVAIGTIAEKSGDKKAASEAYSRAAQIFRSAFLEADAIDAEKRLEALTPR